MALRGARKERGWSQGILAAKTGLSVPTIRFLERTRGNLTSWGKALGILELELRGRNLPPADSVGRQLAMLRKRHGVSQRELARMIGRTHPTIVALERRGNGRLNVLDAALRALGAGATLVPRGSRSRFYTHAAVSSAHHGWHTPAELMETLYAVFGSFDLDPCSPTKDRRSAPVKARVHYTIEDDGLSLPWTGRVFVNPPYGRNVQFWVAKAKEEVECGNAQTVVAVVPARTDTSWWHDHIAGSAHVFFLRGRLRFGNGTQSAPFPSVVAVWGGGQVELHSLKKRLANSWWTQPSPDSADSDNRPEAEPVGT